MDPKQPRQAIRNRAAKQDLWKQALGWLLFLGPFFFLSYGLANELAAHNPDVGTLKYSWEQHIPFVPWTIVPYWSIDILYVLSFFICTSKTELQRHGLRLLTAQIIAVGCFILFPLGFGSTRPETSGFFGGLFSLLTAFDQPYNQAPSLHIALLVILWELYAQHLPRSLRWAFHFLASLIAVSVLTTFQHHFIDVPTGALLGLFTAWLWPLQGHTPFAQARWATTPPRWRLADYYFLAAVALASLAFWYQGAFLWLLWPAVSLLLVAVNYAFFGSAGFQKTPQGIMSPAARWLFLPYRMGAYLNRRLWTRGVTKASAITDHIHLGRFPAHGELANTEYIAVIDVCAEFQAPCCSADWHSFPMLDLQLPAQTHLLQAARQLDTLQQQGQVLVVCALGYARSALTVAAWLLISGRCQTVPQAISTVTTARPGAVFSPGARRLLEDLTRTFR